MTFLHLKYFVLFQLVAIIIKLLPLRVGEILIKQMYKSSLLLIYFMYETDIHHFLL